MTKEKKLQTYYPILSTKVPARLTEGSCGNRELGLEFATFTMANSFIAAVAIYRTTSEKCFTGGYLTG